MHPIQIASQLQDIAPNSKEGVTQILLEILSLSAQDTSPDAQDTQTPIPPLTSPVSNSTYISFVPITKISPRWYIERL